MKRKSETKNINYNSMIWKFAPAFVLFLIVFLISIFSYLFNTYKAVILIENNGFMIQGPLPIESLKEINNRNVKKSLDTVNIKENDRIYKTPLNHYIDNSKKSTVDVNYPLFINDGLSIVNYNDETNLIDKNLNRLDGLNNHVFSYGKAYSLVEYSPVDTNKYILLSYSNGSYINLYDLKIKTNYKEFNIPINSFVYFLNDSITYYERNSSSFYLKNIPIIDKSNLLSFYFDGDKESYSYTYETLLTKLGRIAKNNKSNNIQNNSVISLDDQIEEIVDEIIPLEEEETQINTEDDFTWVKPTVTSSKLKPSVYSISGSISINDPAKVITKAPTYTLYVDGQTYSRRSFSSSGDIIVSGVSPNTTYEIVGQYTYLDEDLKTRKMVTFYSDTITTESMDSLPKIDISYELGDIYPRKIEFSKIKILSDLNSESLRGVKNVGIDIGGDTFYISKLNLINLLHGNEIENISTGESLKSNTEYNFEINFYDLNGNKLVVNNNKGHATTSKKAPNVVLKLLKNEIDHVVVGIDLKNDDNIEFSNYHYAVTNSSGKILKQGFIENNHLRLDDLDPNQILLLSVTADVNLEDGYGIRKDYELGKMEFTSLPITSLGFLNFNIEKDNITQDSISLSYKINNLKTDSRLIKLLKSLNIVLYDIEKNEDIRTVDLIDEEIEKLKKGETLNFEQLNLESNTSFGLRITSVVQQGETEYELECLHDLTNLLTRKKSAYVYVANSFTTEDMIDFDVKIIDDDGAILSDIARIELRDISNKLIESKIIDINKKDLTRITFNYLDVNQNYEVIFIADEYNETNSNSTFKSKYVLLKLDFFTEMGIDGKIELQSSTRVAKGENLVDINSETKWLQTTRYYTIPKTIDEEGDMHIYSKKDSSAYTYDLSEYHNEVVTASFKIKAVNRLNEKVYFCNYSSGCTDLNYGILLSDSLSKDGWTSFSYTFRVGSRKSGNHWLLYKDMYFGKYITDFAGFYINRGVNEIAEYEIRDFEIHIAMDKEKVEGLSVEKGTYDSDGRDNNTSTYINSRVRSSDAIDVLPDTKYEINFSEDSNYTAYIYFYDKNNKYVSSYGWMTSGNVLQIPNNAEKMRIMFRYYGGNLNINPEDIQFEMNKLVDRQPVPYRDFEYNFITNVKVNLSDLKNEIINDTYYIKVIDKDSGKQVFEDKYVELIDVNKIENAIKRINLEEDKNYLVQLLIKVREREYVLDSFEISTNSEVQGIANTNDWSFIQPHGNYIVLNDLDFDGYTNQSIGFGYRYFYGMIDFQGYSANVYSNVTSFQRIGRMEKSAILKNMVLNVHLNNNINNNSIQGFVSGNYGTIENIMVNIYDERPKNFNDVYLNTVADNNYVGGRISNFVIKLHSKVNLYRQSGLLNRYNYGIIENGYVCGENVTVTNEDNQSSRMLALITRYGGVKSSIRNIYVLPSIEFPNNYSYDITGLIAHETYGELINAYTVGNVNNIRQDVGPIVGFVRATAELHNVYYMSDYLYTTPNQNKISSMNLNDVSFQKRVLQNGFNVEELVKLGYYPQVKFTYAKMPKQDYIELPEYDDNANIDIVTMTTKEQTYDKASIEVVVDNPFGDEIVGLAISNLNTKIISQTYENGKSYVRISVSSPTVFESKYAVRSISSKSYNGFISRKNYDIGEKYLYIDFFREVHNVQEWIQINNNLTQNYVIVEDIDFDGYANYYINNFSGKIEGRNHTLKNIIISNDKSGLINQMNGTLQNIYFENVKYASNTSYIGLVASSNQYGKFINVHLKNIDYESPASRTSDTIYMGSLVGYTYYSRITNCSVTNTSLVSRGRISDIIVGGLVGYSNGAIFNNVFVQNADIKVIDSISVLGVGGIVGREVADNASITSAYSTGKIYSNGRFTGGIIGQTTGYVEKSYSSVTINTELGNTSGIVGYTNNRLNEDKTQMLNVTDNLFVGNISLRNKDLDMGRIATVKSVGGDNFALSDGLINGFKSNLNNGETLIDYSTLTAPNTYADNQIHLGSSYDYSQINQGILPKLYYLDTDVLLPNQEDNYIPREVFSIEDIVIDKHAEYATLVLYLKNPNHYLIDSIEVEGMDVVINKNNTIDDMTVLEVNATPNKYYDSYLLNKINYRTSEDSDIVTNDIVTYLDMIFYKNLATYDDWQNVSTTDPENYLLVNDIDFTGLSFHTEVIFNRLETVSEDEYHTLSGMYYSYNVSGNKKGIISQVNNYISNIIFKDITIECQQKTNNSYVNIINSFYGTARNLKFENITINAPNKNRVAPLGYGYADILTDITLNNIHITGVDYLGGLLAYFENNSEKQIHNIDATDIHVTGSSNFIGGLFANYTATHEVDNQNIGGFTIRDSEIISTSAKYGKYIGGVVGNGGASNVVVDNVHVLGTSYVGGAFGYGTVAYNDNVLVKNSNIEGRDEFIGGISGMDQRLFDSTVQNCTITGLNVTSKYVGGLVGKFDSYYPNRNVVYDTNIVNNGDYTGGLFGTFYSSSANTNAVNNVTVTGNNFVGGVAGELHNGTILNARVTKSVIRANGSYAAGLVAFFDNLVTGSTYREGALRQSVVLDTTISSSSYAGGFIALKNEKFYNAHNDHTLYFAGTISTDDGITAGPATADAFNSEVINLGRIGFYDQTLINGVAMKDVVASEEHPENLIKNIEPGYVNVSTGKVEIDYNYPDATHTELIKFEAGHTYRLKAKRESKSSADIFRMRLYDNNQKYLGELANNNNTFNYLGNYYVFSYKDEDVFTPVKDCYVRVVYLYPMAETTLTEITNSEYDMLESRLLDAQELRNRLLWNRYLNDERIDYVSKSFFNLDSAYWDFSTLNSKIENFEIEDRSGNQHTGYGNINSLQNDGAFFDGTNDYIEIPSFKPNKDITISTTITPYSTRDYQHIFSYSDTSPHAGIGLFLQGSTLYVSVNRYFYSTSRIVRRYKESSITMTYKNNKELNVYLNGELIYTHRSVNKEIYTPDSARTFIGNDVNYTGSYKFTGIIKDVQVFNRALDSTEVINNYNSAGITNANELELYYDFSKAQYKDIGYYPVLFWKTSTLVKKIENQGDTPLPAIERPSGIFGLHYSKNKLSSLDTNLDNIYHIYSSGINTLNIEFDNVSQDMSFQYNYGDYTSEIVNVDKRVYSIYYDYLSDFNFTLKNAFGEKKVTLTHDELAKMISIYKNNYYHLNKNDLYKNDIKLVSDIVHIYDNLALSTTGKIYNLINEEYQNSISNFGILSREIPLHHSNINNTDVNSFYNYSEISQSDGSFVIRDEQVIFKNKHTFVYKPISTNNNSSLIANCYNNKEYLIALSKDGEIYSYKDSIKYDNYLLNYNISEIYSDSSNDNPIMIVRYKDGHIIVFNYYNGDLLYEYGNKKPISLFQFAKLSLKNNNVSTGNDTYTKSNKLQEKLVNITDKDIIDLLTPSNNNDKSNSNSQIIIDSNNDEKNTTILDNKPVNDYYISYNNNTNQYEVYSIDDLLNTNQEEIVTLDEKINSNTFLYNYFYHKTNVKELIKDNRLIVYGIILFLILINLIALGLRLRSKEKK